MVWTPPDEPADEPEDPVVEAHIERALAPYRDLLPPEDLAFFREELLLVMESHPGVARRVDRLRRRTVVASGETSRPGTPVPAESETRLREAKLGGG